MCMALARCAWSITQVWDQSPKEISAGFTFFDPKFDPPGFEKTGL